jgi:hypothetical protein
VFFKKNFDLTLSERNLLDDYSLVKGIDWIASISPSNSNVPEFSDNTSTFEEIQVIALETGLEKLEKLQGRLTELVQKYIPYHLLLIVYDNQRMVWNVCQKRININEPEKRVIENRVVSEIIPIESPNEKQQRFLKELSFSKLEKINLKTLYEGYTQRIVALKTAEILGIYQPRTSERAKEDLIQLEKIERMESEITGLVNQAKKEVQMNRRVELANHIQSVKKEIKIIKLKINS